MTCLDNRLGERLSGWSALQQRACIGQDHRTPLERDGSRSDLEDWGDDPEMNRLNSTLAAPMVAGEKTVGDFMAFFTATW